MGWIEDVVILLAILWRLNDPHVFQSHKNMPSFSSHEHTIQQHLNICERHQVYLMIMDLYDTIVAVFFMCVAATATATTLQAKPRRMQTTWRRWAVLSTHANALHQLLPFCLSSTFLRSTKFNISSPYSKLFSLHCETESRGQFSISVLCSPKTSKGLFWLRDDAFHGLALH